MFSFGSCRNNCLLFTKALVLLASNEWGLQHGPDQFSAACNQAGMKNGTKKTKVLCLSRKPGHIMLEFSSNTLQQVQLLQFFPKCAIRKRFFHV